MVALFAAVHLLLFFPVPDKHLRLRLIKHVFWLRVTAHVCVCARTTVYMQMRLRKDVGEFICGTALCLSVCFVCTCICLLSVVFFFFFDLALVSSHYASTGV